MTKGIMEFLAGQNPGTKATVQTEYDRQRRNIELIASRNFVSSAVLSVVATVLVNKYAEGYPDKRYYGGCQRADVMENTARKRACQLLRTDHTNVQPHCDANANYAVYAALCGHGDTVLSTDLVNGGHLIHGSPANLSGKNYNIVAHSANDQSYIGHDQARDLTRKYGPRILLTGASAYPRTIGFGTLTGIAHEVGAYLFVGMTHIAGPMAVGLHPPLMPYADVVTTTVHKIPRDPRGGMILCREALAKKIDSTISPGSQGGPLEHIIAAKAMALREVMESEFKAHQEQALKNVAALAEVLMAEGFGLISGGTDNHLMLMDLRPARPTGKETEKRLGRVNITVSRNAIPNDPGGLLVTSDIRVDTPAATTRGFKEADMGIIASIMWHAATDFKGKQDELRAQVTQFTGKYPLYEQAKRSTPVRKRRLVGKWLRQTALFS